MLGNGALQPVQRNENLTEKVYLSLRLALMRGRVGPGQRLVHRVLAAELGVSQTPVREALLRLASEGAVALDARGTFVPMLSAEIFSEVMSLRVELEGRAAERAAMFATPAAIADLRHIHSRLAAAKVEWAAEAILEENERFHLGIANLAQSPVLARLIEGLWMQCGPTIRLFYARQRHSRPEAHPHLALLAALEKHDGKAARAAMTDDLEVNFEAMNALLAAAVDSSETVSAAAGRR